MGFGKTWMGQIVDVGVAVEVIVGVGVTDIVEVQVAVGVQV